MCVLFAGTPARIWLRLRLHLFVAVPLWVQSLKGIAPGDIASLRTAQSPPSLVKRIMDGVLILLRMPMLPPKHDVDAIAASVGMASYSGGPTFSHADDTTFLR